MRARVGGGGGVLQEERSVGHAASMVVMLPLQQTLMCIAQFQFPPD